MCLRWATRVFEMEPFVYWGVPSQKTNGSISCGSGVAVCSILSRDIGTIATGEWGLMSDALHRRSTTKTAFALVIVSFLLSTAVSIFSLHTMSRHNAREMNKVLATQVYDYISTELSGPIMAARTMASNSFLVDALKDEPQDADAAFSASIANYLSGIESGVGYHSSFVVSDATKRYYTRDGYTRDIDESDPEDSWYVEFMGLADQYDLDVDADERDKNSLTVYVNVKMDAERGDAVGICGVGVRMTGIQELFRTFEESFGVKISLVDRNGVVMVDTDTSSIEKANLSSLIDGGTSGDYVYSERDDGRFVVSKYVGDLDWYLVVQSNGGTNAGQYANIILLNVGLCLVVLVALVVALRVNRRRTDELTSASLVDHMTMLNNKRAFEHDKTTLLSDSPSVDLVCVAADLNGLKRANDNLGHDAGDELIRGAADCLQACFAPYGRVYRTGGDEFCALLHVREQKLEELKLELARVVSSWSGELVDALSISCGYATAWEFPDKNVSELCKIADARMYEDKERYYERMGIERRR